MYCIKCGKELPVNAIFCPNCGTRQEKDLVKSNWWQNRILPFCKSHKWVLWVYFVWLIIHLTLFIVSSPISYSDRLGHDVDISGDFYPFDVPLTYVLDNSYYSISLTKNIDVYDFSEFFVYVVLLPLIIVALYKCIIFIYQLINKQRKPKGTENAIKDDIVNNVHISSNSDTINFESGEVVDNKLDNLELSNITSESSQEDVLEVQQVDNKKKHFPLFRRFVGSIIDKFFIVVVFGMGIVALKPYSGPGDIGFYWGLMSSKPSNYEYIDKALINSYGTYYEGVSKDYQDKTREEDGYPYIGYTKDKDMSMTFFFILFNLLYYILFEFLICASFGKCAMGGKLDGCEDKKTRLWKVVLRALIAGVFMSLLVLLFHFQWDINYYVIIIVFFLIIDVPVFFTKNSLLDIITGTKYVDTLNQ